MLIKRRKIYDKVWVTKFWVFFTRRGTIKNLWFFSRFKNSFKKKNIITFSGLPSLAKIYAKFWFFIISPIFAMWFGLFGHSLLRRRQQAFLLSTFNIMTTDDYEWQQSLRMTTMPSRWPPQGHCRLVFTRSWDMTLQMASMVAVTWGYFPDSTSISRW